MNNNPLDLLIGILERDDSAAQTKTNSENYIEIAELLNALDAALGTRTTGMFLPDALRFHFRRLLTDAALATIRAELEATE